MKRFLANHNAAAIVDCRDDDENTSLHLVSATTHETAVEIVDLLVEYGADLNAKNKLGWYGAAPAPPTWHASSPCSRHCLSSYVPGKRSTTPRVLPTCPLWRRC